MCIQFDGRIPATALCGQCLFNVHLGCPFSIPRIFQRVGKSILPYDFNHLGKSGIAVLSGEFCICLNGLRVAIPGQKIQAKRRESFLILFSDFSR
jgi:hypothetical protein